MDRQQPASERSGHGPPTDGAESPLEDTGQESPVRVRRLEKEDGRALLLYERTGR